MQYKLDKTDVLVAITRFLQVYSESEDQYIVAELQRSYDVLSKVNVQSVILDECEIECLAEFLN